MEGGYREKLDSIDIVRSQRDRNQVFGLLNGKAWSDSPVLLDFLDEIFDESKSTSLKLEKPVSTTYLSTFTETHSFQHQFIATKMPNPLILRPFTVLVPLECLAMWSPHQCSSDRR